MICIKKALYKGGFSIWIEFESGESGIVDLSATISRYPNALPLRDETKFSEFFLDEWPTLAWKCGFDLSPEMLYEMVTGKAPEWINQQPMFAGSAVV